MHESRRFIWFPGSGSRLPVSMQTCYAYSLTPFHYTRSNAASVFLRQSLLQSSFQTVLAPGPLSKSRLPTQGSLPHRDITQSQRLVLGLPHRASLRPQTFSVPRRFVPASCLQPYCMLQPRPGFCCSGVYSSKAAVLSFKRLGPRAVHSPNTNSLAQVSHPGRSTSRHCSASKSGSKIWW